MKYFILITIILGLIGCKDKPKTTSGSQPTEVTEKIDPYYKSKFSYTSIDTIDFDKIKYNQTSNGQECNLRALDSIDTKLWTDKFMPEYLVEFSLYSGHYYSVQPKVGEINLISVYVTADDWSKLYLLTISPDNSLIDQFEIGRNLSYLIDQSDDKERYADEVSQAIMLSRSKYKIEKITKTTIDYFDDKLQDSISIDKETRLVEINKEGKIIIKNVP